ncbi:MAG: hypothetical protein BJ554DRAFT_1968 [Olpidium bornovanus]|uniref:Ubiquitinyl hydrolase 1 n=1 Tax=Olpidium bornovanus TaxID=278681 RepID=A0A8H8DH14_9FUNG|nr:MAG: hypothetical protein BJ554DRAFT_1968 [Olpidium bornovanus]
MVEVTKLKPTPQSIISDIFEGVLESRDYVKEERFYDLSIQIDKRHRLAGAEIVAKEKPAGFLGAWTGHIGNLANSSAAFGLRDISADALLVLFTNSAGGRSGTQSPSAPLQLNCARSASLPSVRSSAQTLMIHLKRFRYDSYFSSKITTHVQFPTKDLDMRPFVKTVAGEAGPEITKYDLYALIHHRGGLGGGHYVAYALSPVNNTWYEYDDSYVTAKDEAEVSRLEAYVLFYRRRMPAAREQERQEVLADIERAHVRLSCGVAVPNPVVAGATEFDDPQDAADGDGHTSPKTRPDLVWISRLWFNRGLHMADPGPISNYDFTMSFAAIRSSDSRDVLALAEERELRARRKREEQDILAVDSSSLADGHCWFLISADWLKTWHAFKAGGSDPGRIRNSHFLHADGSPRKRMRKGLDYRGVNQLVWEYFHGIYGGGPACVRG